jgi:hypothetical protein
MMSVFFVYFVFLFFNIEWRFILIAVDQRRVPPGRDSNMDLPSRQAGALTNELRHTHVEVRQPCLS